MLGRAFEQVSAGPDHTRVHLTSGRVGASLGRCDLTCAYTTRAGGRRHDCRSAAPPLRPPQPVGGPLLGAPWRAPSAWPLRAGVAMVGSGWHPALWRSCRLAQRPERGDGVEARAPGLGQCCRSIKLCVAGSCTAARLPSRAFKHEVIDELIPQPAEARRVWARMVYLEALEQRRQQRGRVTRRTCSSSWRKSKHGTSRSGATPRRRRG